MPSDLPPDIDPAIRQLGELVLRYRQAKSYSQSKLGKEIGRDRSLISLLEQGRRLPTVNDLDQIADVLAIHDQPLWPVLTHPAYPQMIAFQGHLAELLGKALSLAALDPVSQVMLIEAVKAYTQEDSVMTLVQAHDHFNAILTFYGERPVSQAFYRRFLGQSNFSSVQHFGHSVRHFQETAIRIYGSFRKAFKTLSISDNLAVELAPLLPVAPEVYTQRRPFDRIRSIARERLDDLGYISADRVRRQNRERHELSSKLQDLARWVEQDDSGSILAYSTKKLHRIQTLLRKFDSELEIEETLFSKVDPDLIRREALRLAPEDDDLARIEATQERGLQNLSAYLTEPYLDVYIATSMRERADFISVNTFVETIFSEPTIAPLHLRYFNPTLSWISDRVAKGLVEALMLKRSQLTIYMAQKGDTFGKDSEASVALGQGKAVIVYVPRLHYPAGKLDSEAINLLTDSQLRKQLLRLEVELDDDLDKQALVAKLITTRLQRLSPTDLTEVIDLHWADFDLYGELKELEPELRHQLNSYLDELTLRPAGAPRPEPVASLCHTLIDILVKVAVFFERRAYTFKEIHPLALQVILSSGVLNGILVVRSAQSCTQMMYQLLTNTLETELKIEAENYRLNEKQTGSTLRVISRHHLLTNAFWTQYFS